MDLRRALVLLVQCDFDDTITVGNVSTLLRDTFAPGEWREMEAEYLSGAYSVEESNIRQFAGVKVTKKEIEEFVIKEVGVREGFGKFVEYCQKTDTKLAVVSSGLDLYIEPTMRRECLSHVEVHSAKARVTSGGLEVRYTGPSSAALTKGFKDSYVRDYKRGGNTVIYIGDGRSDIGPASEADFIIARSTLKRHLKQSRLPYFEFSTFDDVRNAVEEIRDHIEVLQGNQRI